MYFYDEEEGVSIAESDIIEKDIHNFIFYIKHINYLLVMYLLLVNTDVNITLADWPHTLDTLKSRMSDNSAPIGSAL